MSFIVAIDGPAGTGKGTVTSIIANKCNLLNIDSGATYRCVTLKMLRKGYTLEDKEEIIEIAKNIDIDMEKLEDGTLKIYLDGEDVTEEIRSCEVSKNVSQVSSIVEVRLSMVDLQRKLAEGKDVIMEGRDITTYVFPNADVKIYMDADVEERAKRRFLQNQEKGINMSYEEVLENIKKRDYNDMHKEIGSLMLAEDAILIDTTHNTIEKNVELIENIIKEKRGK